MAPNALDLPPRRHRVARPALDLCAASARRLAPALALAALAACAPPRVRSADAGVPGDGAATAAAPETATEIVSAPGATGEGFGDPARATNGVRGGGASMGSVDVYSLDYAERSTLVLGFGGRAAHDGPGADLVVFENAFAIGTSDARFMDLTVVSVSADGASWLDLPHDFIAADESRYSNDPDDWPGFAGRTPVLLHAEASAVDPFDPTLAGGDAFDLAALGASPEALRIRTEGARYVRLTSAPALVNPDTGAPYVHDAIANGADIDGVVARYVE